MAAAGTRPYLSQGVFLVSISGVFVGLSGVCYRSAMPLLSLGQGVARGHESLCEMGPPWDQHGEWGVRASPGSLGGALAEGAHKHRPVEQGQRARSAWETVCQSSLLHRNQLLQIQPRRVLPHSSAGGSPARSPGLKAGGQGCFPAGGPGEAGSCGGRMVLSQGPFSGSRGHPRASVPPRDPRLPHLSCLPLLFWDLG